MTRGIFALNDDGSNEYLREARKIRAMSIVCLAAGIAIITVGLGIDWLWLAILGFACFVPLPLLFERNYRAEQKYRGITITGRGYARLSFAPMVPVAVMLVVSLPIFYLAESASGPIIFVYFNLIFLVFLLMVLLFPQILVLAYRAHRVEDQDILRRISATAQKLGVRSIKVYVLPWKGIKVANALLTGTFSNKSIFISDYLLEGMSSIEVDAVIAHELGHARKRHVLKKVATIVPVILVEINLLAYYFVAQDLPSFILFLACVVFSALSFPLVLLPLSRRFELEADSLAVEAMGSPEPVASALLKLRQMNLISEPPSKGRRWLGTHPSIEVRLDNIIETGKSLRLETART